MLLTLVKIFQDNVVLRATWAGNAFGVSKAPPLVGGRPGGSQPKIAGAGTKAAKMMDALHAADLT